MGYYTGYSIEIHDGDHEEIVSDLRENCKDAECAFNENGDFEESIKWYDHEIDLIAFSKRYAKARITLYGEGEEVNDTWYKHFKNGKVQKCRAKVTYDEYDEAKLVYCAKIKKEAEF